MNRYKVITFTSDYYVMADYYESLNEDLDFLLEDETLIATFVSGFWKAVMICDSCEDS